MKLEIPKKLAGKRLGIVLPSSNTVLEPLAAQMLASSGISAHFSRLGVIDVALGSESKAQFSQRKHLEAALLLADANVDAIVWGGTSASWLGLNHDKVFINAVEKESGIPTTSCVLAMNAKLEPAKNLALGLVTPYTDDVHAQILSNYREFGVTCTAGENFGGTLSRDFAMLPPDALENMVRKVGATRPDIIFIMCTNLHGAGIATRLSASLDLPVVDSAFATIEAGLNLLGSTNLA